MSLMNGETVNKAIKNRAFHALDSQQVARLLWRRYVLASIKVLLLVTR